MIYNHRELKFARTMIFAVEEINRDPLLLPGLSLGYKVYNGCGADNLIRAAIEAINGNDPLSCSDQTLAILGHSSSGVSDDINTIISTVSVPQISHLSTCACLSDKIRYPTFFRTVPSDRYQITALVELMKYFDWRWIGIIHSVGTYAEEGASELVKEALKEGICVEYRILYLKTSRLRFRTIVKTLQESSSKVVLMFMSLSYAESFLSEMEVHNITGKQWVGSESWITQTHLVSADRKHILQGAIGFALPQASIPGLGEFLLSLKPFNQSDSSLIEAIWEDFFGCSFTPTNTSTLCTGTEDLQAISSVYTDVTNFREENCIYTAVYSVAFALSVLLQCENGSNPTTGNPCLSKDEIQPKLVFDAMKLVNFTTKNGANIFFDNNGDSTAKYDLVNWQIKEDGSADIVSIGQFDNSLPEGTKLKLKDNMKIVWGSYNNMVVRSVCREPCPPGTRKAVNKNKPLCCFDCFQCHEGTISNKTNSLDCLTCSPEFRPNEMRDNCVPKPTEYLSYTETMGALLTGFGTFGVFLSLLMTTIFFCHKDTPIVRANNSELSFLLLFSLKLCFLCSLTFIGRPTHWSCMLRHTSFSITFVFCISCVLGKTMLVLMAFRARLPGSNVMKWFGPAQLRVTVLIFTLVQVVICTIWLTTRPPFPNMNMQYYKDRIILECALGSAVGFWAVLGYIGILAALCFILAFLARKLPDSFNESKLITFSMLIFCTVWITFIPSYVSSPGKFTVAVEIFAILASSFGLLLCIFAPKCYIILLRPDQNSKKSLMNKSKRPDHNDG
ncbi:extracellular calcium-sensing receptor-like [Girardinichthys multiradiatus]|uniref:extracellular calcium-sensing receptor-like n=1 Tax=Girardinichthys multiradiatus TaxID=208333 RepID=UPI001FABD6F7|nr:extracellular calcium-sensing receptor-like [Girardinichthys multiradiatus]